MRIQRKLLTKEQKDAICNKYSSNGDCQGNCPLTLNFYCFGHLEAIQKQIEDFWNEEIEIEVD